MSRSTHNPLLNISVVTPCYNAEKYIEETMVSVLNNTVLQQHDRFNLFYCIVDGNSTDDTIQIAKDIADGYAGRSGVTIRIISEKDNGMYDALVKGFQQAPESCLYGYLNAGDLYSPYAFEAVIDTFGTVNIPWVTGLNVKYNEKSQIVRVATPYKYDRSLVKQGFYGRTLDYIQQESTFWGSSYHSLIDFEQLSKMKLAGDFYLWHTFSDAGELCILNTWLGGFKLHQGQQSEINRLRYNKELASVADRPAIFSRVKAYFYKLLWYAPVSIKKRLNSNFYSYDYNLKRFTNNTESAR